MAPKALSEFLPGPPESMGTREAKLTSSRPVGQPAAHARIDLIHTPAFLPTQGLSVVLKRIMVRIPFFFFKQSFFFFFFLKCKKHLGTAETDTKGGREGCMQGRALAAAAFVIELF